MNSRSLRDRLRNISCEKNVDFNVLLRLYMYDRFIERLSVSKYKDNFILKGGFFLSTMFGIENRATMDIDTLFRKATFNEETITNMMKEIVNIKIDDNARLSFLGIAPIRSDDEYGGFRVDILVKIDNIKERFNVDVVAGDPITPKEILYKYKPVLSDKYIKIWSYNIETVLAEKLETIFSRVELNGRMRDYYDIYLIYTKDWNNININYFRRAIKKTFARREYISDPLIALDVIKNSDIIKSRWNRFRKKYKYANDINFDDILNSIEKMMEVIETVEV